MLEMLRRFFIENLTKKKFVIINQGSATVDEEMGRFLRDAGDVTAAGE